MPKDGGGHAGYHLSFSLFSLHLPHFLSPRHFPRLVLMSLPYDHYRFHFSTPLFFLQPLVCSSLCSLLVLIQSPPRRLLSVSVAFSLPPTEELLCYLITLTVQDVCECVFVCVCVCACSSVYARVCVCVCLSLRDRCKGLALIQPATHVGPSNRGREDECSPGKTKLNTIFLWNRAATRAEIT